MMATEYTLSPSTTSRAIIDFINQFRHDPALLRYKSKLQDHILCRLRPTDGDTTPLRNQRYRFPAIERETVNLNGGLRMVRHKELYIRTATYTGDPALDLLTRGNGNFIVKDTRDSSKYQYRFGEVMDIFHVSIDGPEQVAQTLNIIFVRWYRVETNGPRQLIHMPYRSRCPPRLKYVSAAKHDAFSFLDPTQIIRAVTIVPDIPSGTTIRLLGPSIMRYGHSGQYDYRIYLVACQGDHDLSMRYHLGTEVYNLAQAIITAAMPPTEDEPLEINHAFPPYLASGRPYHAIDNETGVVAPLSVRDGRHHFFGLLNESDSDREIDLEQEEDDSQGDSADEAEAGNDMDFD